LEKKRERKERTKELSPKGRTVEQGSTGQECKVFFIMQLNKTMRTRSTMRRTLTKKTNITREEIEASIEQAVVPITSTDAIKWRTRAGMGECQGARCRAEVADIIAQKLNNGTSFQDIPKRVPGSPAPARVARRQLSRL